MNKTKNKDKIIIGIDPGTQVTGYGIIESKGNSLKVITYGSIFLGKTDVSQPLKLKRIFERVLHLVETYLPDEMAIETQFYAKNIQSMLKLGRAQGVAMSAALFREIPIFEYAPTKIKQAVTGNGRAGKHQVQQMVEKILNIKIDPKEHDASDALAIAICHFFQNKHAGAGKSYKTWKAKLKDQGKI